MNEPSWQQVWEIFEQAVKRPAAERQAYLAQACGDDLQLRRSVAKMLAADQRTDTLLDSSDPRAAVDVGILGGNGSSPGGESSSQPKTGRSVGSQIRARGTEIGQYRILRRIGQGGMSTVYLAERADQTFPRRVAIKLVRPEMESEAILDRLRVERRILASLDHPYIARLFDGGTTDDGLPYFVMEYVEGVPIDDYCEQNQLTVDERLSLFRKVCEAVHTAHQNLVVHRDIKPSNLLVVADGTPKLLDFGIAKLLNPELADTGLEPTSTWHRILTPSYASPEQIRGELITTASDVYSLGVLLYELLTGRLPRNFAGQTHREIENLLFKTEPVPPSVAVTVEVEDARPPKSVGGGLQRRLAGDLDAIVLKSLRSAPRHRYGSVEQLAADIERSQDGLPVLARAGSWRYRAGKFLRRHRRAVAAAAVAAALVIGFAVTTARQAERLAAERDKKAQVLSLVLDLFRFSNPYVLPDNELTVREALTRSVPVLEDALRDQPEVRAELLHTAGSILWILGEPETARGQLEEALEIRRGAHGDQHPDVIETLNALSAATRDLGELENAEALARESLGLARELYGEGHAELTGPLNELVLALCYQHEYDTAQAPADEMLALVESMPVSTERRLTATEFQAVIHNAQGNYREGTRFNRQALALHRARYGELHPDAIGTLNNLGLSLRRLGDFEGSVEVYQEAIQLQRKIFGEEHEDPYLVNNLAGVYFAMEKYDAAEELYRRGRDLVIERYDSRYWMVYHFEVRLGQSWIRQGDPVRAEHHLRRILEDWRAKFEDRWQYQHAINILGESVSIQGRCDEAEPLLTESFELLLDQKERVRGDALERLQGHFERCGRPQEVARFEAMLPTS